jgi:hypothetical protein
MWKTLALSQLMEEKEKLFLRDGTERREKGILGTRSVLSQAISGRSLSKSIVLAQVASNIE